MPDGSDGRRGQSQHPTSGTSDLQSVSNSYTPENGPRRAGQNGSGGECSESVKTSPPAVQTSTYNMGESLRCRVAGARIPQGPRRSSGKRCKTKGKYSFPGGASRRFLGWTAHCLCWPWVIGTRLNERQVALPIAVGYVCCRDGHIPSVFGLMGIPYRDRL